MCAATTRPWIRPGTVVIPVHVQAVLKQVRVDELRRIPNAFGAYVIEVVSGEIYVGSSNTVRARVQAHRVENDPNIREPIRSVCCYLTPEHMDARILEQWLIREVGPELNLSCPAGEFASHRRCDGTCERLDPPGRVMDVPVHVTAARDDIRPTELEHVTTGPGVYVLRTGTGKRYVGVSGSVRARVRSHRDHPAHPNLDAAIRSVGVFETGTEADARILEYALIRELDPELNRENQADASEWKVGRREALVALAPPDLQQLQRTLGRRIEEEVGGTEVFRRSWVTYQLSPMKNYCAVKVLSDCLQLDLKVDERTFRDARGVSEPLKPTQAWTFNRRVRIRSAEEIDGVIDLIAQARRSVAGR